MSEPLTIGARNRTGLCEITDTHWNANGTLSVTVRELYGAREIDPAMLRAMRALARRAISRPHLTRSARTVRTWHAGGGMHATFAISRVDPRG